MTRSLSQTYRPDELDELERKARAQGGRYRFELRGIETRNDPERLAREWLETGGVAADRLDAAHNEKPFSRARSYLRLDELIQRVKGSGSEAILLQALERELSAIWRNAEGVEA